MSNLRFVFRTLLRGRAYLFAILVLAAGIGMSTAVFSLANAVLFQPLPFPHQDALRVIWKADTKSGVPFLELAYPELRDLQQGVPAFASVAVMPTTLYGYGKVIRFANSAPVQVESAPVSHDFFKTLGVKPMMGRDFADTDEHPGAAPVVILSYATWRSAFHGDRGILGRPITLNGQGYRVIGVAASDVDFPRGVGLWVPLGVSADLENRNAYFMQAIARVKPGYSYDQVNAQVNGLFRRLAGTYTNFYSASQSGVITPLTQYWVGSARLQLLAALGASFLLLATGWITASNLFLSRAIARGHEIATRSSLGASARQIFAQFAAEGFAAAFTAALIGLLAAWALVRVLIATAPANIPGLADAAVSWQVVAFGAALSLVTAAVCSAAPALIARRKDLEALLREGGTRLAGSRSGHRLQHLFTVGQVAITVVLLAASVLVVISVRAILKTDIGFANRDAVTMNLALHGPQMNEVERRRFYAHLLDNLRSEPGVTSAGAVLVRPLEGSIGWDMPYQTQYNVSPHPQELPVSNFEVITPGYFQTVGTPIREGRDFGEQDREDTAKSAVISEGLAEQIRRTGHVPLGTRIRLGRHNDGESWTIVGVTGNTRYRGVTTRDEDIYVNYRQSGVPVNYLVIRGRGTPAELTAAVQKQLARLDSNQAVANVATIGQLADRDTARQRFNMVLLAAFGVTALALAAAGVYSVVAENVSMRSREIAIRLALGADRLKLVRNFAGGILGFVLIGELVGLAAAILVGNAFSDLLYGTEVRNPVALGSVVSFLFLVALIASSVPAWVAAGQEPRRIL